MRLQKYLLTYSSIILLHFLYAENVRADMPEINTSVTFFYYKDIVEAEKFYGEIIGLKKVLNESWVKMYKIPGGGIVGLVDEEHSTPGLSDDKPVMLSIVTTKIDEWYERIKADGERYIIKHLNPDKNTGILINAFLLIDPGGYHVEFFQWKEGRGLIE
jgi:predicted enzyme related to lactoylglutathione lyase